MFEVIIYWIIIYYLFILLFFNIIYYFKYIPHFDINLDMKSTEEIKIVRNKKVVYDYCCWNWLIKRKECYTGKYHNKATSIIM